MKKQQICHFSTTRFFNNTFHLNPNCWSIPQHATNSTSSDAFRFAHLRQHSFREPNTVAAVATCCVGFPNFFQIGSQNPPGSSIQQFLEAISFSSIVRVHETCLICHQLHTKIPRSRRTKRISDRKGMERLKLKTHFHQQNAKATSMTSEQ